MISEFKPNEEKEYPRLLQSESIIILAYGYDRINNLYEGTVVHVINPSATFDKFGRSGNFNAHHFVDCKGVVTLKN